MNDRAFKKSNRVEVVISSTGVFHVDSASLLGSPFVQEQVDATNRLMQQYREKKKKPEEEVAVSTPA